MKNPERNLLCVSLKLKQKSWWKFKLTWNNVAETENVPLQMMYVYYVNQPWLHLGDDNQAHAE